MRIIRLIRIGLQNGGYLTARCWRSLLDALVGLQTLHPPPHLPQSHDHVGLKPETGSRSMKATGSSALSFPRNPGNEPGGCPQTDSLDCRLWDSSICTARHERFPLALADLAARPAYNGSRKGATIAPATCTRDRTPPISIRIRGQWYRIQCRGRHRPFPPRRIGSVFLWAWAGRCSVLARCFRNVGGCWMYWRADRALPTQGANV